MAMPKRVDKNQAEIVKHLRSIGATVFVTSMIGKGYADLTCMVNGNIFLIEIKDGSKPLSQRKLTPKEQEFYDVWGERVEIVTNLDEATQAVVKYQQLKLVKME